MRSLTKNNLVWNVLLGLDLIILIGSFYYQRIEISIIALIIALVIHKKGSSIITKNYDQRMEKKYRKVIHKDDYK